MFPLQRLLATFTCTLFLAVWTSAQSTQPQTADDFDKAGFAAQQQQNFEEALQLYAAALRLNPKDWIAQANSGVCYMALRKFENAVSAYKAAAALVPGEPRLQFDLGVAYAANGQNLEARESASNAAGSAPSSMSRRPTRRRS